MVPSRRNWFNRLQGDHPNLRAALSWFREREDLTSALRLAGALGRFWEARGLLGEGRRWLVELLTSVARDEAGTPPDVRAKGELWAGTLIYWQGDLAESDAYYARALRRFEEAGDERGAALCLLNLGQSATYQGDVERGRRLIVDSLARFTAIGDDWGIAAAQTGLINPLLEAGDLEAVDHLLTESLPLVRAAGDPDLLALTLINRGWLAVWRGEDDAAEVALRESLALFRQIGERRTQPYTLNLLARVAWRRGQRGEASVLLREGLTLSRDLGSKVAIVNSLVALTSYRARRQAVRLGGAAAGRRRDDPCRDRRTDPACRATLDRSDGCHGARRSRGVHLHRSRRGGRGAHARRDRHRGSATDAGAGNATTAVGGGPGVDAAALSRRRAQCA